MFPRRFVQIFVKNISEFFLSDSIVLENAVTSNSVVVSISCGRSALLPNPEIPHWVKSAGLDKDNRERDSLANSMRKIRRLMPCF